MLDITQNKQASDETHDETHPFMKSDQSTLPYPHSPKIIKAASCSRPTHRHSRFDSKHFVREVAHALFRICRGKRQVHGIRRGEPTNQAMAPLEQIFLEVGVT